jgi:hypothetical protein
MSNTITLTDLAIERLAGLGVSQDVLTASDKWGDSWVAVAASDISAVDPADLVGHKHRADRLVLVVAKGEDEAVARTKMNAVESETGLVANSLLVWAL